MSVFSRLASDDRAQGTAEYAIVLSAIVVSVVATLVAMSGRYGSAYNNVANRINQIPTS